jgi:hypothetical protein
MGPASEPVPQIIGTNSREESPPLAGSVPQSYHQVTPGADAVRANALEGAVLTASPRLLHGFDGGGGDASSPPPLDELLPLPELDPELLPEELPEDEPFFPDDEPPLLEPDDDDLPPEEEPLLDAPPLLEPPAPLPFAAGDAQPTKAALRRIANLLMSGQPRVAKVGGRAVRVQMRVLSTVQRSRFRG